MCFERGVGLRERGGGGLGTGICEGGVMSRVGGSGVAVGWFAIALLLLLVVFGEVGVTGMVVLAQLVQLHGFFEGYRR